MAVKSLSLPRREWDVGQHAAAPRTPRRAEERTVRARLAEFAAGRTQDSTSKKQGGELLASWETIILHAFSVDWGAFPRALPSELIERTQVAHLKTDRHGRPGGPDVPTGIIQGGAERTEGQARPLASSATSQVMVIEVLDQ